MTMSIREVKRYDIIKKLINKDMNGTEAAKLLDLTIRHIRRLKKKVDIKGIKGLIHGNRGRISNRKMPDKERKEIVGLLHQYYPDFKPGFASEKLDKIHNIRHDPKTIRKIMIEEELWKPKRKKKINYHSWRQRRSCLGEMLQYDGSYEFWFESRAPKCCLLASIDDATSTVWAKFDEHEGVEPTFNFWKEYIRNFGKPHSIYVDKFSTYSMNHKLAKENDDTLTQFQRAMRELGIEPITAHSSQAKGRVERLFGTLQDRLIKELRLNDISTMEEANEFLEKTFLPEFNARFKVEAISKADLHKKLTSKENDGLDSILSRQYKRTVRNDFTISYKNNWYQMEELQPATICKRDIITVEERLDKTIHFRLRGKYLNYKQLPKRPDKASKNNMWVIAKTSSYKPAIDHPWRKFQYSNKFN